MAFIMNNMQGQHLVVREVKDVIIFHVIYFIAQFILLY